MIRRTRRLLVLLAGVTGAGVLASCGGGLWMLRAGEAEQRDCAAQVAADEAKVRTDRVWTGQDVPGIGDYAEIHWQVDFPSFACSRAPGPTDLVYQGVVRLAPADARALGEAYRWQPAPAATQDFGKPPPMVVWPGLAPYVPDGVRWLRSPEYDDSNRATVQLDPDRALLLVATADM
ncbi:hypothetical protein [Micromonospora inositola]|uniref:Uncharacterized protein n=1 Tax=Micromonospora inositola TaxID=47865 RepID=A0A1C5JTL3_9ACTN|nr:hypothetical protein [Micromonospora inositola]SCG73902.1 hypothetical protein GA0070613_5410 [Micromonospora inositola]